LSRLFDFIEQLLDLIRQRISGLRLASSPFEIINNNEDGMAAEMDF